MVSETQLVMWGVSTFRPTGLRVLWLLPESTRESPPSGVSPGKGKEDFLQRSEGNW